MSKKLDIVTTGYYYRVDIHVSPRLRLETFTIRRCALGQLATNRDQQYRAYAPLSERWARHEKMQALTSISETERNHAIQHREPVYVPVPDGFEKDAVWGRWHACNK